jgi:hypothetical protein
VKEPRDAGATARRLQQAAGERGRQPPPERWLVGEGLLGHRSGGGEAR